MAVYRETVLTQTTAATAVTTQRGVISDIQASNLGDLDELTVYLNVSTGVTGGALDIFLQRAVVPDPVAATDAHWQDYLHFAQVAAGQTSQQVATLPVYETISNVSVITDIARSREMGTMGADAATIGHWYDQLRVLEIVGAGVTVAGVYSIHITGRDNR